ncbi:hypothetical protein R5R35_001819 [Gryllus longicercus]|uniref:RRM domain-containing protein n=1 Tax=Gryllus longicercus TaxID=2509291 RepID=A0AAN9ZE75_9ORTH
MDEDSRTIWCGNLSENVSEEILYELFLQAGPLQSVRIPKSREGKQRAFGFVTYKHECSVPYALALFEGTELFRKELRLQSRNPDRIQLDQSNRDSGHNRSQSLPARFAMPHGSSPSSPMNPMNFDALLFMGQHLLSGSVRQGGMYSSQGGASQYLGGSLKFNNNLSNRSLQGGWSNRNHPYSSNSGSNYKRRKH